MLKFYKSILISIIFFLVAQSLFAKLPVRIKDIAIIEGVQENQLMGFGLITGLNGRGDSRGFKLTQKMLRNLASNHGFSIDMEDINSKNIAAVLVTTNIGPFVRKGDKIDITISSVGDSKSIEGGILLQTPLKAADGNTYAVAQGRIISGNKDQGNRTTASIPDGAIVEKNIAATFIKNDKINIILKYPDFVTANQIKEAVLSLNSKLDVNAIDAGMIEVTLGDTEKTNPVDFIARLEVLTVIPDYVSTVVIDKKTGIIVVGEDIIIQACSVSTPFASIKINKRKKENNFEINSQSVGDLIKVLNEAGLDSNEVISLIESIHKIGAINAKLVIL